MLVVSDLMTEEVYALHETDTLRAARSLMSLARIRHIPVVTAEGRFLGLLTHRDLLAATASQLADLDEAQRREWDEAIPVGEVMRRDVTVAAPGDSLRQAAETLLRHKYGCLPVVENDRVVGILTESDFLRLAISLLEAAEEE